MDGMDGKLDMPFGDTRKWNAFYYRTRANVDYVHQFAKLDLNVAGNFGLSNFNYEPYGFKKQKFTSGDVHFGVKSTDETLPLQYLKMAFPFVTAFHKVADRGGYQNNVSSSEE